MKTSMFNVEQSVGEGVLIYNSLTSGVLFLNEEYAKEYFNLKNNRKCNKDDLVVELKKGQMLINRDENEVEMLKFQNHRARFDDSNLTLTIAPTMECNFACPYCFEEGVRYRRMDKEVENQVVKFVKKNYAKGTLSVCWYGGEPMLGLKKIETITKMLWEDEKIRNNYEADIVTNGYYLNKKNALILKDLGVKRAQITLDGPPDIHDTRRVPKNGKPTFDIILDNIKQSADILKITIRVNVDRSNISRVTEILDILDENGLKNKVGFYIAAVDDTMDSTPNPLCFNDKEFSEEEVSFYVDASKKGYNIISVPGAMLGICGAISLNSYVIDSVGDLYKCWDEVSRKEFSVGNVWEGPIFNDTLAAYMNYDAAADEKCNHCPVLPACLGGCPNVKNRTGISRCSSILHNASKVTELMYLEKQSIKS